MTGLRSIENAPVALLVALSVALSSGCGAVTSPADAGPHGSHDGAAESATDGGEEASGDGSSDPCAPGTCRFMSNPSGPCLPPGGPVPPPDSGPLLSGCCMCGTDGFCTSECVCASPDTPIATPAGDRPIASLSTGDLVWSVDHGALVAVPIRETRRTPVTHHRVVEVALAGGGTLDISAGHPTADGRTFGDLRAGDWLGGRQVASVAIVPYPHAETFDILPDSETGTYLAGGALVGSTLRRPAPRTAEIACAPAEPALCRSR